MMTARLAVGPGAVARAIAFTRAFAGTARLSPEGTDRLAVIVEEYVANIVEHGRAPAGSLMVLRLERAGQGVRLSVSDAGVAFDLRSAKDPGPNLERGGGAGIALIRGWSEIEDYRRRGGRNRLVLRSRS
jgi:serine/threonine-protein kinase RsbW